MKLHSPQLERTIRRAVRRVVRATPALKREFKRARQSRRQEASLYLFRPFLSIWLLGLVAGVRQLGGSIDLQLGVIALWGTGMTFVQARRLIFTLYRSTDVSALFYLPITNEALFRWESQKFARGASWLLGDFLAGYVTLASVSGLSPAGWTAAVIIAVAQSFVVLASATLLVIHWPHWPHEGIGILLFFSLLVMTLTGEYSAPWLIPWMDKLTPLFYAALPSGWVSAIFRQLLPGALPLAWVVFIPIGALIGSLPRSWKRLKSSYAFTEPVLATSPDEDVNWHANEELGGAAGNHRAGPTEIEDSIRDRSFLRPMPWNQHGWIERLAGRWLGLREKVIVEFMMARVPRWTILWKKAGVVLLIGLLGGRVWQRTGSDWFPLAYGAAGVVAVCLALPLSSGFARGFQAWFMTGTSVPFYASFPVGYREIARAAFKIAAVRCLAAAPLAAIYGMIVAWQLAQAPGLGIILGLKAVFLVLVARPMLMVFRFSSGTSDIRKTCLRSLVIFGAAILFVLAFAWAALLTFQPDWQFSLIGGLTSVGTSTGFSAFYRMQYDRHRFDLIQHSR